MNDHVPDIERRRDEPVVILGDDNHDACERCGLTSVDHPDECPPDLVRPPGQMTL